MKRIFARLFKVDNRHEAVARAEQQRKRSSILDAVMGEAKRLDRQVSKNDKVKLDEYFTSVREIEQQIQRNVAWAGKAKPEPKLEEIGRRLLASRRPSSQKE